MRDSGPVRELMEGATSSTASPASACELDPRPDRKRDSNATGTIRMLPVAREVGVKAFVFAWSAEVYGAACRGPVREDGELAPTNVYAGAKLGSEGYARAYHACYGVPSSVLASSTPSVPAATTRGTAARSFPSSSCAPSRGSPSSCSETDTRRGTSTTWSTRPEPS